MLASLAPNEYRAAEFSGAPLGRVRVRVASQLPLQITILDNPNYDRFRQGLPHNGFSHGFAIPGAPFDSIAVLPNVPWRLLMVNGNSEHCAVDYNAFLA